MTGSKASRFKQIRLDNRINQQEMAAKLGIAQSTVVKLESEELKRYDTDLLLKLVNDFNIDLHWFYTGEKSTQAKHNTLARINASWSQGIENFGKMLSKIQAETNSDDKDMAKIMDISENRYEKLVTGKEKPYLQEVLNLVDNVDITLDLLLLNRDLFKKAKVEDMESSNLSPNELELLKKIVNKMQ